MRNNLIVRCILSDKADGIQTLSFLCSEKKRWLSGWRWFPRSEAVKALWLVAAPFSYAIFICTVNFKFCFFHTLSLGHLWTNSTNPWLKPNLELYSYYILFHNCADQSHFHAFYHLYLKMRCPKMILRFIIFVLVVKDHFMGIRCLNILSDYSSLLPKIILDLWTLIFIYL